VSLQDGESNNDGDRGDDRLACDDNGDGILLSTLNVVGMASGWYRTGDCGGFDIGLEVEA
jgi:hypothetical protein